MDITHVNEDIHLLNLLTDQERVTSHSINDLSTQREFSRCAGAHQNMADESAQVSKIRYYTSRCHLCDNKYTNDPVKLLRAE